MTLRTRILNPGGSTVEKFVTGDDCLWAKVMATVDGDANYYPTHISVGGVGAVVLPDDHSAGLMRCATDFYVPTDIQIVSMGAYITCYSLQDFAMPDFELWWASMPESPENLPEARWGVPLLAGITRVVPGVCNPSMRFTFTPAGWPQYFRPNSLGQCRILSKLVDEETEPPPGAWQREFQLECQLVAFYNEVTEPGTGPSVNIGAPGASRSHSGRHGSGSTVHS